MTLSTRSRAELVLLATTIIWGSTFVLAKAGMRDVSPFVFIALRFALGGVLFWLIFFRKLRLIRPSTIRKGLILGAMLGIGLAVQNIGIYQTTASKSGFITGMLVVFTPIAQLVIERRAPKIGNLVGIVIVTLGLYFLTSPEGSGFNSGDMLVLLAAVIFGIYIVYVDLFTKDENVLHIAFIQIAITAVIGALVLPFETIHIEFTQRLLLIIGFLALFATVVTTYTQTRYQRDTTPTRAAILFTLEPVISAVLAHFFLEERLGPWGIVGGSLIVGGILVSELSDTLFEKLLWRFNVAQEE